MPNEVILIVIIVIVAIIIISIYIYFTLSEQRHDIENIALNEIEIGMKKEQVDEVLGSGKLEKTTQNYIQYRYIENNKISDAAYSINWNLKGGRTYFRNRKSYLSIKFSKDTMEVIEIINKL